MLDKGLVNEFLDVDHAALVIKYVFGSDNFDVIALCETWLGSTMHKGCLAIVGATGIFNKTCPKNNNRRR